MLIREIVGKKAYEMAERNLRAHVLDKDEDSEAELSSECEGLNIKQRKKKTKTGTL